MAVFLVIRPRNNQVPPANVPAECEVFQGDYASAALAVDAAINSMNLRKSDAVWVMSAAALTKYEVSILATQI